MERLQRVRTITVVLITLINSKNDRAHDDKSHLLAAVYKTEKTAYKVLTENIAYEFKLIIYTVNLI